MNDTYYGMYGAFQVPCGQYGGEMSHMDQMRLADDYRREPPILPRIEETMRFSDPISSGHDTSVRFITMPEPTPNQIWADRRRLARSRWCLAHNMWDTCNS